MNGKRVLVTGAGGFIGHHLVTFLKGRGYWVRGVDIKRPEFTLSDADDFQELDLRYFFNCLQAVEGIEEVYGLAADMGGMGFISCHHSEILHNNALININMLEAARTSGVKRYFYSSSACVYPEFKQTHTDVVPLKEEDAYPAQPQDGYGWEKLFTEQLCLHYREDYGLETRVARFHNIYGEEGTWAGGREKAPAALCRKIAIAKLIGNHEIEMWGDGLQTRSFCYIGDCLEGIYKVMQSDYRHPLNVGSKFLTDMNNLAYMIADIAGIEIHIKHIIGPEGVRGRNSDNTLIQKILRWEPRYSLFDGISATYKWIEVQVISNYTGDKIYA